MQQAFRSVLCDGKSLVRVVPSSFNIPSPLMQHCLIGNHFVNVSYMLLAKQPMRVCWMGEQADEPFEPDVDAYANALPEEEFHLYYATAWVSASPRCEIPLGQFSDAMLERAVNLRTTGSYLINRTRRTFIDIAAYISSNLTAGKCYDPLPLLTACGNGRGEDEFLAANCGYELIGTWAFDLLEYSKQRPDSDFLPMTVTFEQSVPAGKLTGKSFVVTGKISGYTRSELEDLIRRAGGQAGGSVTRSTDYLVVADKPGSTKLNAAAKHGTKKINVQQLMDMLNT